MMAIKRKLWAAVALASVLTLAGCWDDDNNDTVTPPVASTEVPDSAGASTAAFVSFILSLAASDEASEPLTITERFAVPADESAEPTPLT
jgi:uncharacterized lipoprotein YajG